jgi:hypothetical protein
MVVPSQERALCASAPILRRALLSYNNIAVMQDIAMM